MSARPEWFLQHTFLTIRRDDLARRHFAAGFCHEYEHFIGRHVDVFDDPDPKAFVPNKINDGECGEDGNQLFHLAPPFSAAGLESSRKGSASGPSVLERMDSMFVATLLR